MTFPSKLYSMITCYWNNEIFVVKSYILGLRMQKKKKNWYAGDLQGGLFRYQMILQFFLVIGWLKAFNRLNLSNHI